MDVFSYVYGHTTSTAMVVLQSRTNTFCSKYHTLRTLRAASLEIMSFTLSSASFMLVCIFCFSSVARSNVSIFSSLKYCERIIHTYKGPCVHYSTFTSMMQHVLYLTAAFAQIHMKKIPSTCHLNCDCYSRD